MKKICLHIAFLFVSFSISAQSYIQWPESNAQWYRSYNVLPLPIGYVHSFLGNDTLVLDKTCKKVISYGEYGSTLTGTVISYHRLGDILTYQSNDSVFRYNQFTNQFNLSFKLTAEVGDIWDLGQPRPNDSLHAYVKVTNITTENYNGMLLRNFHIKSCYQNGDTTILMWDTVPLLPAYIYTIKMINERIGAMPTIIGSFYKNNDEIPFEGKDQYFFCYYSDSLGFYKKYQSCYGGYRVSIDEITEEKLLVFPNPAHNQLNIELKNFEMLSNIEVFNALGQCTMVAFEYHSQMITLNTQSLCNGFYLLKLNYKNGESETTKFQILK